MVNNPIHLQFGQAKQIAVASLSVNDNRRMSKSENELRVPGPRVHSVQEQNYSDTVSYRSRRQRILSKMNEISGTTPEFSKSTSDLHEAMKVDPHSLKKPLPNLNRRKPSILGIEGTVWIHRFIYKTKKHMVETKRLRELAAQKAGVDQDKATTHSQEASNAVVPKKLERQASWGNLRSKLIRAKITDAFTNIKFTVNGETYTALKCLGEGGYSKVYEVFDTDKNLFALKVVSLASVSETAKVDLKEEVKHLQQFKGSDHVIQLLQHEENEQEQVLYLLLERGECDLSTILSRLENDERMTPAKLRFYWEQMLEAVHEIHKKRIVHADLKPANFVLVRGHLKVIDFGLAGELPKGSETLARRFVGGTRDFMSPEAMGCYIIEDGAFDVSAMKKMKNVVFHVGFKSDIWALGVILYHLAYNGIGPYSSVPGGRLGKLKALLTADLPVDFEPLADKSLLDTMKLCLEKDPDKRATIPTLLKHPFLRPATFTEDDIASD